MPIAELGWATLAEAVSYFANERHVTTFWDAVLTNDNKNKLLNMAFNRIHYDPDYSTPTKAAATAAQKVYLIKAQAETAYYLALHLADEDRRKGIQVQGVIHAGIVKEIYSEDNLFTLPLPPFVKALLEEGGFASPISPFYAIGIDRDEDDAIDEGEGT